MCAILRYGRGQRAACRRAACTVARGAAARMDFGARTAVGRPGDAGARYRRPNSCFSGELRHPLSQDDEQQQIVEHIIEPPISCKYSSCAADD